MSLFWPDEVKASKRKAAPPEPVWLKPDYLPGLKEALAFDVPMMDDDEIIRASRAREQLVCDIEIYENYFLAAFTSMETGKCICIEEDMAKLKWILHHFQIVTFNGI